ncbi:MAG: KTSC domain-containing protein, partial [Myxococcales bacterium]|nr:KTSC domain-containing protein [Myxococcales bacterium]
MQRVSLHSAELEWVSYDPNGGRLQVQFVNGGRFEHRRVPRALFNTLCEADDPDDVFFMAILDRYDRIRIG